MSDDLFRVLIVEESDDIRRLEREVVRQTFRPALVEIEEIRTAREAVERYQTEAYHLLLLDVSSQQASEAIRDLVRASRTRQRCPVIAFSTGRIDQDTLRILAADHCFAIFPKPFDPESVQATIREALEAHSKSIDAVVSPVLHGIMKMLHSSDKEN